MALVRSSTKGSWPKPALVNFFTLSGAKRSGWRLLRMLAETRSPKRTSGWGLPGGWQTVRAGGCACRAGTWARTELFPELAARWREPVTRHEAVAVDARPIEHVREAARGR